MESSSAEQQQIGHPCSFFEQVVEACLKCLGLHDERHYSSANEKPADDGDHHHQHPPPQAEREMKFNEDAWIVMATRSATAGAPEALRSRPPKKNKPPISSGQGGQIN